ncbi:cupin domain-containing protein [Streptomyces sp. NBC_01420]|uniref:cupin domain-containing protein n=1 Tax=Streptomyces sp. NBC_01420 TaxID=2903858 RepID=UPI0032527624
MTTDLNIINLRAAAEALMAHGVDVHGADARGLPLHSNGHLGVDLLQVPPNTSFPIHVHPGDHLLLCLAGEGTISVGERTYEVRPGDIYMVDGDTPHAVGAGEAGHTLLAIGAPHKPVESPDRMNFTDWSGTVTDAPLFVEHGHG